MQQHVHPEKVLARVGSLKWDAGRDFHDELVESIYTDAARIADRAVTRKGERGRFDLDRTIDRLVTSRPLRAAHLDSDPAVLGDLDGVRVVYLQF